MSKEETQKIVLEVMQHNLQNMVQQATQAAETTSVRAVDSGLKKIKKDCETSLSNSDKALKEIEEMKEKEKMAALVSTRDRVAAKNAAKAAARAEAAAKKAEKMMAEAGDRSYAELEELKNTVHKHGSDIDSHDRQIIVLKAELSKTNFFRAVSEVASPKDSSRPGTAEGGTIDEAILNRSFDKISEASNMLNLQDEEQGKKAVDLISMELWKIREEVLQLAKKSAKDIDDAVVSMDKKNKHTLIKSTENATRAVEEAIANWKAEQTDESEEQLMALITDIVNSELKKMDGKPVGLFSKQSSMNDDLFNSIEAKKEIKIEKGKEEALPLKQLTLPKSKKFTFAKAVNTVVVEERKKRKSILKGKPDLSNTLMDRIETLETQMKKAENDDALGLIGQLNSQLDNFKTHILGMLDETRKIPIIREDVDVLQVTTDQLVETSEKKMDPDQLMELMKDALDEQFGKFDKRLKCLEDVGDLMTDFTHNDDDSDSEDEETRKRLNEVKSFLPPRHVALKEVMCSLRESTEHSQKRPGDFIWAGEGTIEKMQKDIHWLRINLANGLSNLQFKVQLHSDFLGDFEEIRGFAPAQTKDTDDDDANLEKKSDDKQPSSTALEGKEGGGDTGATSVAESKELGAVGGKSDEKKEDTKTDTIVDGVEGGIVVEDDVVKAARKKKEAGDGDDDEESDDDDEDDEDGSQKKKRRRKITLKERLETMQKELKLLQDEGSEFSNTQTQQKIAVRSLVENILTLQDDMGNTKEKLSTLEGGKEVKRELQRVAEQMAELFDTSSGIAQSMSSKAETEAVSSIMEQLTDYSKRSAEELRKLEGSSSAKIKEAQAEMKRQLAHEIEQALMNLPKGGESNALLRGHCLSCNQQIPRAKPRFPRLLVNPSVRNDGDHGDLGVRMNFHDEGSYASIDPSIESMASQLTHAEKMDVMGGGFRLQPPERHQQDIIRQQYAQAMPKQSTKPIMKKNNTNGLIMKQKVQRDGIGRLQPMLPVPNNNKSMELDFSNNAPPAPHQPQGLPTGAGVAPFARKLMPWEKEGDPLNTADSLLVEKQRKGKSQQYPTR